MRIFPSSSIALIRRILLLSVLCIGLCGGLDTAAAQSSPTPAVPPHQPRQTEPNRQRFALNQDIFVSADFEHLSTATEFAKWLRTEGATASNGAAFAKARSRILFQKSNRIDGIEGNDVLQITIKSRLITVAFTSENALRYGVLLLQSQLTRAASGKYFQGGTLTDWGSRTTSRNLESTTDAASTLRSVAEIEDALKRQPAHGEELYVTLVSPEHWRMQSRSLEGAADPAHQLYPADGYYTVDQLGQMAAMYRRNGVEMIPTLELMTENRPFTEAFGHSIFSVEGMRLVRAAIEDCVEMLSPQKICLGTLSPGVDMRYLEFISNLAAMLQVELVIIKP